MEHKAFINLSQEEKDIILKNSMLSNFDVKLSFGIINNGILVGYALLREEEIDNHLQTLEEIPFEKSAFACRILYINRTPSNLDLDIFPYACKIIFERVRIWNDVKKGDFSYIWFLTKNEGESNDMSNIGDCECTKALESPDSMSYIVYKKL